MNTKLKETILTILNNDWYMYKEILNKNYPLNIILSILKENNRTDLFNNIINNVDSKILIESLYDTEFKTYEDFITHRVLTLEDLIEFNSLLKFNRDLPFVLVLQSFTNKLLNSFNLNTLLHTLKLLYKKTKQNFLLYYVNSESLCIELEMACNSNLIPSYMITNQLISEVYRFKERSIKDTLKVLTKIDFTDMLNIVITDKYKSLHIEYPIDSSIIHIIKELENTMRMRAPKIIILNKKFSISEELATYVKLNLDITILCENLYFADMFKGISTYEIYTVCESNYTVNFLVYLDTNSIIDLTLFLIESGKTEINYQLFERLLRILLQRESYKEVKKILNRFGQLLPTRDKLYEESLDNYSYEITDMSKYNTSALILETAKEINYKKWLNGMLKNEEYYLILLKEIFPSLYEKGKMKRRYLTTDVIPIYE